MIKKKYRFTLIALFIILSITGYIALISDPELTVCDFGGACEKIDSTDCFEGDCYNGKGHYFFSATTDYEGEFKDGKFNGLGIYTTAGEDGLYRLTGSWKSGKADNAVVWKLRQIGLLDDEHSWWYSVNLVTHTGDYTEFLELDSWSDRATMSEMQVDCENNLVRPTKTFLYDTAMALGGTYVITSNDDMPSDWLDIQMNPKADLYINICDTKRLSL